MMQISEGADAASGELESLFDEGLDLFLIDGDCGLCNRLAQFMIPRLKEQNSLTFLPIESRDGQRIITGLTLKQQSIDTVYLFRKGRVYIRSAAVVRGLFHLSWWWAMWASIIWLIPLPLRDLGYRIIAKYRHRLFKKMTVCTFA
jgi:predicted DCC family thiol-disulfide oxidoreductase YuxK